ncbi:MAG: DUF924 domain-containing protein [Rhodobacteraceae bacterium]|nr:MAG: DUF924 domain-containing protein [Paracoccaceae bacterium]
MSGWQTVLDFWLNEVGPEKWYAADPALDAEITRRFGGTVTAARKGELDDWILHPEEALALLIVLDQFPRNMWRDRPEAFDGDAHAVALAKRALNLGHDVKVPEPERQFFYLPLMHSEHQMDQDRCVRLILMRMPETGESNLPHAIAHRDIIRKFGRFPFRNAALSRRSTAAEAAWMADGGYRV